MTGTTIKPRIRRSLGQSVRQPTQKAIDPRAAFYEDERSVQPSLVKEAITQFSYFVDVTDDTLRDAEARWPAPHNLIQAE